MPEPAIHDDIGWLIENWARWSRLRIFRRRGRCSSLEGGYRAKAYHDAPPITPLGRPDEQAALMVEAAWTTLPHTDKLMLKWHYVFSRSPGAICRSLRQRGDAVQQVSPKDYPKALAWARMALVQALDVLRKNPDDARVAVSSALSPPREGDTPPKETEAA